MHSSGGSDGVEFLEPYEPAASIEESLPEPRRQFTGPRSRALIVTAALALLALAGFRIVRAVNSPLPPHHRAHAAPAVRLPPIAEVTPGMALSLKRRAGHIVAGLSNQEFRAARCPARFMCARSERLPSGVRRALRRYFPGLVLLATQSVVVTDGENKPFLWFRRLAFTDGRDQVAISVEQPVFGRLSGRGYELADRTRVAFVRTFTGTAAVTVQIVGPARAASGIAFAAKLARDPGLQLLA